MKKVSAHWVSRMLGLTDKQKQNRVDVCINLLCRLQALPQILLHGIVTQDENWVHHFDPETKRQSMVWKHASSPTPKKFKVTYPICWESRGYCLWNSKGVIMRDHLPKGSTVTGPYYANELALRKLRKALKSKRRGKLRRGVLLLQDNAPAHTSAVATSAVAEYGYELLLYPPYLPDLAPSDFYLFPLLKEHLSGTHFSTDNDVIAPVQVFLQGQDKLFYKTGVQELQKRWNKCIEVGGDYVEK